MSKFVEVDRILNAPEEIIEIDEDGKVSVATPKPRAGEHVRWADQYDFDRSDPATRLFVAASNWVDRCEAAESERDSLAAQNRELVEALASIDQLMMAMPLTSKIEHQVHGIAHRTLRKVQQ